MKKKQKLADKNNNVNTVNQTKDTSPSIPQRSKYKGNLNIYERELNEKQKRFLELAKHKDTKLIFVSGPAGTSKTFLAVYNALKMINEKRVSDLIYVRSAVESADSKLGFLPGESDEKMRPYIQPLMDKLVELLPRGDIESLDKDQRFTGIPVGYLRGLNFNAKVIIADEAQNLTYKEIFTLITRTGEFSKVFVLGDPEQSDINGKSGFLKMVETYDDEESRNNGVFVFRFEEEDIVRSGLVRFLIKKTREMLLKK